MGRGGGIITHAEVAYHTQGLGLPIIWGPLSFFSATHMGEWRNENPLRSETNTNITHQPTGCGDKRRAVHRLPVLGEGEETEKAETKGAIGSTATQS